jgi:hypothetical protein
MFACKMIRDGKDFNSAIRTACRYYDTDMDDVRHYVSQRGRRRQVEKG